MSATSPDSWQACCSKTDVTFIKFMVQVTLGFSVIIFSMIQIIRGVDNDTIYFTMISTVFGVFVPHPSMKVPATPILNTVIRSTPPSPLPPITFTPIASPVRPMFPAFTPTVGKVDI